MNTLLNDERDRYASDRDVEDMHARRGHAGTDREITLGTMTILGIFFALAVLCAGFFGFGYSTGRHASPLVTAAAPIPALNSSASLSTIKPSAGNVLGTDASVLPPAQAIPVAADLPPAQPKPAPITRVTVPDPDSVAVGDPVPVRSIAIANAPVSPATPAAVAPGSFMVQVAAVSHQEDADLLVTTLRRVHYAVAVHTEPQDKLLHVQIGPFTNRKEADAMRQRLLGDGFNAIVK